MFQTRSKIFGKRDVIIAKMDIEVTTNYQIWEKYREMSEKSSNMSDFSSGALGVLMHNSSYKMPLYFNGITCLHK